MDQSKLGPNSLAVHGDDGLNETHSVAPPIFQASTFFSSAWKGGSAGTGASVCAQETASTVTLARTIAARRCMGYSPSAGSRTSLQFTALRR